MLNSNLARVICLAGVILGWVVFGMVMRPVANAPKVVLPRIETVVSPEKTESILCNGVSQPIADVAHTYAVRVQDVQEIVRFYGIAAERFCTLTNETVKSAIAVIAEKRAKGQPIENPSTLLDANGVSAVEKRIEKKRAANRPIGATLIDEAALRAGDLSGLAPDRQWFLLRQMSDTGIIAANGLLIGKQQSDALRVRTRSRAAGINTLSWTSIGPGNVGGRIRAMVIDPVDPLIMYVGGVTGGMWKTTNGGASWDPLNDFMANLAIHSLVIDPTDRRILYAGTGEEFRGAGIFKSTDSGATWAQLAATATSDFYYVRRMAIASPGGISTLYAVTDTGVFLSTNAGVSWTKKVSGSFMDIDVDPNNQSKLVAGSYGALVYTTDGGTNWTRSTTFGGSGRVELGYATSASGTVYASVNNNDGELWKSIDGGATWTKKNVAALSQGDYDNTLWVDPTNANAVVWGGTDLYKTVDGGTTVTKYSEWWRWPLSPHADNHYIVAHPNFNGTTNKTIYVTNDGGVWKAENYATATSTSGWQELNNTLGVTQFYGGVGSAAAGRITGGTQDNGTQEYSKYTGSESWTRTTGGDGGFTAADDTYWYGEYVYLNNLCRSTWGGSCVDINGSRTYYDASVANWVTVWKGAPYEITDAKNSTANFVAPFILDPNNTNTMIAGGRSVWRTTNVRATLTNTTGPIWKAIKSAEACVDAYTCYMSNISSIAVQPGNSDVIYVGTNGDGSATYQSKLYKTTDASATTPSWTRIDTGLPNRTITRIVVNPVDTNIVYVVFGGYSSGNVYRSTDGGTTWAARDGSVTLNLPDVPVYSMAIHPTHADWLYAGTELGVYTSEDAGATWLATMDGPVNTAVYDLQWMGSTLIAATFGRGMFTAYTAAPFVESVRGTVIGANTIDFSIVFNEVVTAVDASDFVVLGTDSASGTIGSVSGSGTTYTVRVTPAGSGTVQLGLSSTVSISDSVGTPLSDTTMNDSFACFERTGWICPLYVTSTGDSGVGTLRDQVVSAPSGSTIVFATALEGQTITLASQISTAKTITIDGGVTTTNIIVSGGNATRLFLVTAGGDLTLRRLNLTGGLTEFGAAGFITPGATMTVDRSAVYGNSAKYGGGFFNDGTLNITNSTLATNDTFQGGMYTAVTSSDGAALYNNTGGTATIINATLANNRTNYMAVSNSGTLTVRNSIIANTVNYAGTRASIYDCYSWGTLTMTNSVDQYGYCSATYNADPVLGTFGLNGGGTRTYPIVVSTALKAPYHHGDATICASSPIYGIDQRGVARTAPCDIGAYEFEDPSATATPTATATVTSSNTATATAIVTLTSTATATATHTGTVTKTATVTQTSTAAATDTETKTPSQTATMASTSTPTVPVSKTPTETGTRTPTYTATRTVTKTWTRTVTKTATRTATKTFTRTRTRTATPRR